MTVSQLATSGVSGQETPQASQSARRKDRIRMLGLQMVQLMAWLGFAWLAIAKPAAAHHAMGNLLPANFWEGFLSGLAHPVIGLDHLAFVVVIGFIAAQYGRGALLPAAFLLTALVGTSVHVMQFDLPATELAVSLSVILFGAILGFGKRVNFSGLVILAALAGLFHGYAYGESIIGAETTPLIAYLIGFTLIQYLIAMLAVKIAQASLQTGAERATAWMRYCGYAACAIGVVFLSTALTA